MLHVAALPFPTPQGTQAAIRFMLEALQRSEHHHTLLTYASGTGRAAFEHRRSPALWSDGSQRSGPSVGKLINDAGLALALSRSSADLVVAHHVEAAFIAALSRRPFVFVAHTALGPELPTYFAQRWSRAAALAGDGLDRFLARRASAVAAVSPALADRLSVDRGVASWPIPWPVPPPITREERRAARDALGIPADARVVLYAGNLDGYQGIELLEAAMRAMDATWLVASQSSGTLPEAAHRAPLATEHDRRRAHAAADVVAVPRRSPGGLPVKILDALARGVLVAAVPRALAGHRADGVILAERDDDARALAKAIDRALSLSVRDRSAAEEAGRRYVATDHSPERFRAAASQTLAPLLSDWHGPA